MSGPRSAESASDSGAVAGTGAGETVLEGESEGVYEGVYEGVVEGVVTAAANPRPEPAVSSRISREPLSVDALLGQVSRSAVGGIGLFVGLVRNHDQKAPGHHDDHDGQTGDVTSLDYTAHPTAEHELHASAWRVAQAFDVLTVAVEHRIGHLEVGDLAVVVAVGAVHRGPALEACRALIDDLKQTVPIWKEQRFTDGAVEWVGL